jgi:hypothetical protein
MGLHSNQQHGYNRNHTNHLEKELPVPEYFVEMTGSDTNDGKTPATAWKSVKWAVSAAEPDSAINIGKGTFSESFEIKKNLLLRGAGQTETVIQCPADLQEIQGPTPENVPELSNPANLGITQMIPITGAVKVRFEHLRISGFKALVTDFINGIFATDPGAHLEFESCEVIGFRYCHILVVDGRLVISASKIGFSEFKMNCDLGVLIGNLTKATITDSELGVWIDHCIDVHHNASLEVIHCKFEGSNTKNANGVRMRGTSTARIAHCTMIGKDLKDVPLGFSQSAIDLVGNAKADIHDNHLSGFAAGLNIGSKATARVWGNTITDNFNTGVNFYIGYQGLDDYPDFGGGLQGSPGENVIKGNGSLTGYDFIIEGKGGTIYARFNEWGTTDVVSCVKFIETVNNAGSQKPFFDFLPLKQVPQPEPLDSIILLDQSSSMLVEGKWEAARSAVNVFSTALSKINCNNSNLKLGLMTFAKTETTSTVLWKPLAALPQNPAHFADELPEPELHWGTPLGKGLIEAKKQLEPLTDGRRKYIFLLSDGKSNTGTPPVLVYPGFNQLINVYSIGFGDDSIDPEMLSEISDGTLGDYYLTGSTDNLDLKRFYLYSLSTPLGISIVINTRESGVTTFPINEGESKMLVMIGWEDAALALDFDLQDPLGNLITPQQLQAGVIYQAEAGAPFGSYTVENPAKGDWKLLNVRRKDNGLPPEVVRFVALDPNVVAQFGVDHGPSLMNHKLRLYARLLEGGAPLDSRVAVKITSPEKSIGTLVASHLSATRNLVDELTRRLPADRTLQRSDILKDYTRQHHLAALPTTGREAGLMRVAHPSDAEGQTGYYQTEFTPTEEGTYTFEFHAEGMTRSGQPFRRTYTVSKYVSFMADPEKTIVVMTAADLLGLFARGLRRYKIVVTPVSANGNLLGPFNSSKILFSKDGVPMNLELRDMMDGSYEAYLLLKRGEDPGKIRLRVGSREFPPSPFARRRGCLSSLIRLFQRAVF